MQDSVPSQEHINIMFQRLKNPFLQESAWHLYGNIDINMMNKACDLLVRHTDFTSFSRLHSDTKTNLCTIFNAFWEDTEKLIVYH